MEPKLIASQLKSLAEEVERAQSDEETRDSILETARLILEIVHEDKDSFDNLDPKQKKRTFRTFGNIGSKVRDFYSEYGGILDESSAGLKNQLEGVALCVSEIQQKEQAFNEQLEELKTREVVRLEKEEELRSLEKTRQDLTTKIEYLKTLEQLNTPEILERMRIEADSLQSDLGERFENDRKNLKEILDDLLKTASTNFDEQYQTFSAEIVDVIAKHRDKCRSLEKEKRRLVSEMEAEIADTKEYFEKFPKIVSDIKEDFLYYEAFNKENVHIYEKMKNSGFRGPDDFRIKGEELKEAGDKIQRDYEAILRKFLDAAEKFQKGIEERQRP